MVDAGFARLPSRNRSAEVLIKRAPLRLIYRRLPLAVHALALLSLRVVATPIRNRAGRERRTALEFSIAESLLERLGIRAVTVCNCAPAICGDVLNRNVRTLWFLSSFKTATCAGDASVKGCILKHWRVRCPGRIILAYLIVHSLVHTLAKIYQPLQPSSQLLPTNFATTSQPRPYCYRGPLAKRYGVPGRLSEPT